MSEAVPSAITALFERLSAAWLTVDVDAMKALWATEIPAPLYLAEEARDFATSWDEFDQYWRTTATGIAAVTAAYRPILARVIDETRFLVPFGMEWTVEERSGKRVAGSVRGIAIVHVGDEALFEAYIEAPLAPVMYMRELYQLASVARDAGVAGSVGQSPNTNLAKD